MSKFESLLSELGMVQASEAAELKMVLERNGKWVLIYRGWHSIPWPGM